jgi:hypothetical protein
MFYLKNKTYTIFVDSTLGYIHTTVPLVDRLSDCQAVSPKVLDSRGPLDNHDQGVSPEALDLRGPRDR